MKDSIHDSRRVIQTNSDFFQTDKFIHDISDYDE